VIMPWAEIVVVRPVMARMVAAEKCIVKSNLKFLRTYGRIYETERVFSEYWMEHEHIYVSFNIFFLGVRLHLIRSGYIKQGQQADFGKNDGTVGRV